ncbi:interferon-induced protein 44-like isoform X4 [Petromyzon marinus]|uniref:Interferon-induced protein 44-like isoform X4 n=1 Tax=Petromyzon marinus TaxID=7757 RepID=A0AAJ7T092_PETMA|nr:interferon-induced protein 44-like isoform X4 [Petromyzon marinus]
MCEAGRTLGLISTLIIMKRTISSMKRNRYLQESSAMALSPKLSSAQQQKLLRALNLANKSLRLLYKGSTDGFNTTAFHTKCNNKGPTITVAYNAQGYIFGGYVSETLTSRGGYIADNDSFVFRLEAPGNPSPSVIKPTNTSHSFYDASNYGPTFGGGHDLMFLPNNGSNGCSFTGSLGHTYSATNADIFGNDLALQELEVYTLDEKLLAEKPWRNVSWTEEKREQLMRDVCSHTTQDARVKAPRVLLLGQVGAGKSSFFNSLDTVFAGHVTTRAAAGSSGSSLTSRFRTYQLFAGRGGKPVPVQLCDTMGMEEGPGTGIDPEDVVSVLQGHVPDRYQFNPVASIERSYPGYIQEPELAQRVHCLVFVIDAGKVAVMSERMQAKLQLIRSKANKMGIPQLILLTKVDEACPLVEEDIQNIYRSQYIKEKVVEVASHLGMPVSSVLPIKNYAVQLEPDTSSDILLLMALLQMLRYVDDFLMELVEA